MRIPPTVYYDLLADVVEAEEEQEPKEITLEDVQGYCKPRCLTIITNELLYELTHPKIKALEQEPRWIPVSEKLPKVEYGESDSVLVCFENGTQDVLYFDGSNWCYPTGESYISVNHKNGWHNKVIAWMPLPTPFEPQKSEET